jgi:hypothetical protein
MATATQEAPVIEEDPLDAEQHEDMRNVIETAIDCVSGASEEGEFRRLLLRGSTRGLESIGSIGSALTLFENSPEKVSQMLNGLDSKARADMHANAHMLAEWEYKGDMPTVDTRAVESAESHVQKLGRLLIEALGDEPEINNMINANQVSYSLVMRIIRNNVQEFVETHQDGGRIVQEVFTTEVL